MQPEHVWDAAKRLVKRYGDRAPNVASAKARALLEEEAIDRRKEWLRIMVASKTLLQADSMKE